MTRPPVVKIKVSYTSITIQSIIPTLNTFYMKHKLMTDFRDVYILQQQKNNITVPSEYNIKMDHSEF